jgi:GT2 family glycosyltransferase
MQREPTEEAENVGICGGNLYTTDLQPNHSYATFYPSVFKILGYRSQLAALMGSLETFNTGNKPKDVAIIIGADLLIKKQLFDQLGGFDPAFFMYIEDGELCLRAKKQGYRIVSVPEAKIIHYQGKSSTTGRKLIMEVTSYLYYFKKHHSKSTLFAYKITELASAIAKFLIFSLAFKKEKAAAYLSLLSFIIKNIF